jgi:GT2 family glycosyltransferase
MQDYSEYEVIVWDNGSTDNSAAILQEKYRANERVKIHISNTNYGVAGGRNRACELARGDIYMMLDNDAFFEKPNALDNIDYGFGERCYANAALSFKLKRSDGYQMWPFCRDKTEWGKKTFETIRIDGGAFAIRKEQFQLAGGFPEHFSPYGVEDLYFSFKLLGLGGQVYYYPLVSIIHDESSKDQHDIQYQRHIRNNIWMILELFPWGYVIPSLVRQMWRLLQEAREDKQVRNYARGVLSAFLEYRHSRRSPIPHSQWKRLRALIRKDKNYG